MKPDFSGKYILDREASVLNSGAAAFEAAVLRIEHREPEFRCQAEFVSGDATVEFSIERTTDGREVAVGESEVSRLYWDGDALVNEDRTRPPEPVVTISWRYELIDAGCRLRATEQIRGGGRDQDNVWEFERRRPPFGC